MDTYTQTIPYFYIIRNKITGIMYAGSKWAEGCHPDTFMTEDGYRTSSPTINSIIEEYGIDAFEILRIDTYCDGLHPYDYETLFLQTNNCARSLDWYNTHNNDGKMAFGTDSFKLKTKETCMLLYGVDNIAKLQDSKEKVILTNIKKYGVPHHTQCIQVKTKIKESVESIYGTSCSLLNQEIKKKTEKTMLEKYGVTHPSKSAKIIEKKRETCLRKYGVEHNSQTKEFKENSSANMKRLNSVELTCETCGKVVRGYANLARHKKKCGC